MNIFVVDNSPEKSANYVFKDNPKRGIKMILESTQLLCTALNEQGHTTPYKSTHKAHPCTLWTSESYENWLWVWKHAKALSKLYTLSYNKTHKCEEILNNIKEIAKPEAFSEIKLTDFVNCAKNKSLGLDFTYVKDVNKAYKEYLNKRKLLTKEIN